MNFSSNTNITANMSDIYSLIRQLHKDIYNRLPSDSEIDNVVKYCETLYGLK